MSRSPKFGLLLFTLVALSLAGSPAVHSQSSSNLQYQVANLVADVRLLDERLRQMSSELEEVRRENARLRDTLKSYEASADSQLARFATVSQLNESIRTAVKALESRDEVVKREVVDQVSKQIEDFANKVNKALGSVPQVTRPDPNVKTHFSTEGIPRSGTPYTVAPGDSLAGIAKKLNSRVDWIQNVNKISDPKLLQVGQVIFVPQEAE